MKDNFSVALCQMYVVEEKSENITHALAMIEEASSNADLVILPEMWNCPYETRLFPDYAEEMENSPTLDAISKAARDNAVYIVAGSIPEKHEGNIYNSSFIFNPRGEIIGVHRKVHLFDIDVPGKISFRESETLTAGSQITVVDTPLCKIGICICYDMRFSELLRLMTLEGAELNNNVTMLVDFHSSQPNDVPGKNCIIYDPSNQKSLKLALFINNQTHSPLVKVGNYSGVLSTVSNRNGITSVVCEVLSPHSQVEPGSVELSYSYMRTFLEYAGVYNETIGNNNQTNKI